MSSIEDKFALLKKELGDQERFNMQDVETVFPDMKKSSRYWVISKMVQAGYLQRVRNGVYSMNELRGKPAVYLSEYAKRLHGLLEEEGYDYYISGVDVIVKFMQHVPEQYPVMLFMEKGAVPDVLELLQEHSLSAVEANIARKAGRDYVYGIMRPDIVIYGTDNFDNVKDHVAIPEKAFIDLFYAVTRDSYPLSVQELARVYSNMIRLGILDCKKMVTMSYKRNLQYDIRHITEDRYVSDGARELVKYMRGDSFERLYDKTDK